MRFLLLMPELRGMLSEHQTVGFLVVKKNFMSSRKLTLYSVSEEERGIWGILQWTSLDVTSCDTLFWLLLHVGIDHQIKHSNALGTKKHSGQNT